MSLNHGFELIRERHVPELNTEARLYRHAKTGAQLLSLINDDENKVFGITFPTPPQDSTGLPHILEHSVLSGSRKYPLREPFVELMKGSLKTFVNAFTFPDRTCYPVASQNLQDFYNLIDVYLDAVLYPLIPPETLQQEGWHYELEDIEDPLIYKGVVYNEMKGVYSSPNSTLSRYSQRSLFPDSPYGLDSGGDPKAIPALTYEQFKTFHDTYYHPSNGLIYFYGDDDPDTRLSLIDDYLKDFEPITVDSSVALQAQFDEAKRFTFPYGVGQDSDEASKYMLTVNWLLTESTDPETVFALQILSYILVSTSASPLRKALIDSGLGEDLTGGGLRSELRQIFFSTGLKGVAGENVDKVESLILNTLRELTETGLEPEMIEAALNTVEFRLRENNTGSYPRGLILMLSALSNWLYQADPIEALEYEAPLAAIKNGVANDKSYFEKLIKTYLLDNPHRTTVILEPDPTLNQREEEEEKARLAEIQTGLSREELEAIIENTRLLKLKQETPDPPEKLALIPRLALEDLDKEPKFVPTDLSTLKESQILFHDLFTNGIVYLNLGFNMHTVPQDLLPYASLLNLILMRIGTETEDFVKLSQRIGRKTGGVGASTPISSVQGLKESTAWFVLGGKSTMAQVDDMLDIMRDVILTVKLDNKARFKQLLLEEKAGEEAGLIPGGHGVVAGRLNARFSEAGWVSEQMGGIDYLFFLRKLIEQVDQDWPAVLSKLETVRRVIFNRSNTFCNVTLDEANWAVLQPKLNNFLDHLPAESVVTVDWSPQTTTEFEGLTIPAQVNYVGKGANLYELGYELHGSILVITNYLRTTWLWEKIRAQGGAYGGFVTFSLQSGTLNYLSYRDPNLLQTLDNYDLTGQFLRRLDLSEDELTKSIIGAIGQLDAYQLPDAKGYSALNRYLTGMTDEKRQQLRDEVLRTTAADFKAFADVLDMVKEQGQVVVLGSSEAIKNANAQRNIQLKVTKVL